MKTYYIIEVFDSTGLQISSIKGCSKEGLIDWFDETFTNKCYYIIFTGQ